MLSEQLDRFIEFTSWAMEKPKPYGPFHIIFSVLGITVCLLLAWLLRKVGDRGNRIVLFSVGLFLILTEVYKQLFYYYHIEDEKYNFGIFPFQLCSVPMYLCIIAAFVKSQRINNAMYGFMTTFNFIGGIMAFIEPSGIVHDHLMLTLHAFVWHLSLIFIGAYLLISGRGAKTMKDYRASAILFVLLCAVAFTINLSLWDVSGGDINMFFVGPRNSSLIVFKQISEYAGWYVSTLLYIPTVCLGAFLIFLPSYFHNKKTLKRATCSLQV